MEQLEAGLECGKQAQDALSRLERVELAERINHAHNQKIRRERCDVQAPVLSTLRLVKSSVLPNLPLGDGAPPRRFNVKCVGSLFVELFEADTTAAT